MANLRKSLAFSLTTRYGALVIQAVALVVLARLLTPEEVGVYAVGVALLALANVIGDFGVEVYLVQAQRLRRSERRAAVAVTLVTSMTVGVAFMLIRGPVASFYGEPRLDPLMLVMGITLFFVPITLPMMAMLRRKMMFGVLLFLSTAGYLVFAVTAIALGAMGHGAMSLAWATLAQTTTVALLAWWHRTEPIYGPGLRAWPRLVRFGLTTTSTIAIFRLGMSAPDLIIGRMLGLEATGLFTRAHGVAQSFNKLVLGGIQPVALPALSLQLREGRSLKPYYLKKTEYIAALAWPGHAFLALMADPVVRIVLGQQWLGTVPIIQILCLMGIFTPFAALNSEFFLALGKPQRQLAIEAATFPLKLALIGAASLHSLEAVALALVGARWANAILSGRFLSRELGYSRRDTVGASWRPLVILLASIAGPAIVLFAMPEPSLQPVPVFLAACLAAALGWLTAVFATRHPFEHETRLVWARLVGLARARRNGGLGARP
jgi:O-antigen/teichoic acid export membrane protein